MNIKWFIFCIQKRSSVSYSDLRQSYRKLKGICLHTSPQTWIFLSTSYKIESKGLFIQPKYLLCWQALLGFCSQRKKEKFIWRNSCLCLLWWEQHFFTGCVLSLICHTSVQMEWADASAYCIKHQETLVRSWEALMGEKVTLLRF